MDFIMAHKAEVLATALGISELLGMTKAVKANGIAQLVVGIVLKVLSALKQEE